MREVAELNGDGIAAELRDAVHAINEGLGSPATFRPINWTIERRDGRNGEAALAEGVEAARALGAAIKYPTATETVSPNQVLRDELGLAAIHRPCRTYPGVSRNYTGNLDIHIVRVATGGTYEDAGHRIGRYSAVSVRVMDWNTVEHAAHFAFRLALSHRRSVTSASKYTIQRAADGLFEECVDEVAKEYRNVERGRQLFDALLASLIMHPERYDVIITPNEYGDFLSDAAYGLVGSIGIGASASYAFTSSHQPSIGVFDPGGGTAPDIAGKGVANPVGAIEAYSYLLDHLGHDGTGKALRDAVYAAMVAGERTADLGGSLNTMDFTTRVIERTVTALGSASVD